MKNVLFVFSTLDLGGVAKMISFITRSLPSDYDIDILLNTDDNIQFPYRGNVISLGVSEPNSRVSVFYQGTVFIKRLKRIRQLKKNKKYDAVISILDSANIANILTKTKGTKSIVTCVNVLSEADAIQYKLFVNPLVKMFYNKADVIVAQTNPIADDMICNFGIAKELIKIIPNAIDVDEIQASVNSDAVTDEIKKFYGNAFITAGRLDYQKGQWHLIRAFSKVHDQEPEAKLVIYGIGELEEYLKRLTADLKLDDSIFFKGFDNQLDIFVGASRAYVFPSMFEGMPTVILQSMACKTPCIVTDFRSGSREIIGIEEPYEVPIKSITKAKYGIITPICSGVKHEANVPLEESEEILANAMLKLYRDSRLRDELIENGFKRSLDFDIKNVINQWIDLIES